jgi:hypothetical protein
VDADDLGDFGMVIGVWTGFYSLRRRDERVSMTDTRNTVYTCSIGYHVTREAPLSTAVLTLLYMERPMEARVRPVFTIFTIFTYTMKAHAQLSSVASSLYLYKGEKFHYSLP